MPCFQKKSLFYTERGSVDSCNMENQGSIKPLVEREVLHKDSNQTGSAIVSPDFMRKG
jgi:hypothetical protein